MTDDIIHKQRPERNACKLVVSEHLSTGDLILNVIEFGSTKSEAVDVAIDHRFCGESDRTGVSSINSAYSVSPTSLNGDRDDSFALPFTIAMNSAKMKAIVLEFGEVKKR